jgi:DNA-binding NarL/FixJ family response regulator
VTPALQSGDLRGRLTPSEWQTAVLAAAGRSNKEIAAGLCLSVRTVESYLQNVYEKLGIRSRGALAELLPAAGENS